MDADGLLLIAVFALCAGGALAGWIVPNRRNPALLAWAGALAALGALWVSADILRSSAALRVDLWTIESLGTLRVSLDRLAALFLLVAAVVTLASSIFSASYLRRYVEHYSLKAFTGWYLLLFASLVLILIAADALLFLLAWGAMSILSYFLVNFEHRRAETSRAGYLMRFDPRPAPDGDYGAQAHVRERMLERVQQLLLVIAVAQPVGAFAAVGTDVDRCIEQAETLPAILSMPSHSAIYRFTIPPNRQSALAAPLVGRTERFVEEQQRIGPHLIDDGDSFGPILHKLSATHHLFALVVRARQVCFRLHANLSQPGLWHSTRDATRRATLARSEGTESETISLSAYLILVRGIRRHRQPGEGGYGRNAISDIFCA